MIKMGPELAEICGIHAGDGYLRLRERNKGEVEISGHLEERGYYNNHVVPLFNKVFNFSLMGKEFRKGTYGIVTYKKTVRDTLVSLGFPSGKKSKTVRIPKTIRESEEKIIQTRFLRGLFDTDGNLYFRKSYTGINNFKQKHNHYPVLSITTISKDLVEDLIKILHTLNLNFNYRQRIPKRANENKQYIITISGVNNLKEWMKEIGVKNRVKLSRYLLWEKHGFCSPHTTLAQREDILKGKLDINSLGS